MQRAGTVVRANYDRDRRPRNTSRKRQLAKATLDRKQRWFRSARPGNESEIPILDLESTPIPFVRPGIDKDTRASPHKHRFDLPIQRFGLRIESISPAVQTHLRQDQRAVAG